MVSKRLVAASAVPLVLSVLARGESYGYALSQRVLELSNGRVAWNEGMLYPVLHRLERDGLIESRWGEADGRKRRYYRISAAGRAALSRERDEWLAVHTALADLWRSAHA